MSKAKINQLWPIPLFEGNFLISENIKQKFYNEEFERMPNENGAFSVNKYILDSSEYEEVRNKIMSCVNAYAHSFLKVSDSVKFYLQQIINLEIYYYINQVHIQIYFIKAQDCHLMR